MTEIEIKAHVYDKDSLLRNLNEFAVYNQTVERYDTYYHLYTENTQPNGKPYISCRIRKEFKETPNGTEETTFLTYKKKETLSPDPKKAVEVNDEKETIITCPEAITTLLSDIGFKEAHKKTKKVTDFTTETEFGTATLEVCNVEKLGDFLEIEILSESNDKKLIESIKNELKKLLKKSGIPESQIEPKYYTQMLRELTEQA
ncbi:MAG: hypothetical protein IJL70_10260 [Treponema sp.]|nr:hypothetical protein [Treponema sp.]